MTVYDKVKFEQYLSANTNLNKVIEEESNPKKLIIPGYSKPCVICKIRESIHTHTHTHTHTHKKTTVSYTPLTLPKKLDV